MEQLVARASRHNFSDLFKGEQPLVYCYLVPRVRGQLLHPHRTPLVELVHQRVLDLVLVGQ